MMRLPIHISRLLLPAMVAASISLVGCGKNETGGEMPPFTGKQPPQTNAVVPGTNLVVDIDGTTLTEAQLADQIGRIMSAQARQGAPAGQLAAMRGQMRGQVLDRFVSQTLLVNEATRLGIGVTDVELAAAIEELTSGLPKGVTLDAALDRAGVDKGKFQEEMTRGIRVKKLIDQQLTDLAAPTDDQVRDFYKKNQQRFEMPETAKARHILIKCDTNADDATRAEKKATAEACRGQLLAGADFATIAAGHSECPSKDRGGDLGQFGRGQMVKPFETAAFSQEIDAIGPVIATKFGYHVIQVTERAPAGLRPLADVKESILSFLTRREEQTAVAGFVDTLKKAATITYPTP